MSIDIAGLTVEFSGTRIIDGVDLRVGDGQVVGLVGPNGSGKSTLLRTVYRVHRPSAGQVLLDGADLHRMSPAQVARRLAVVTQESDVPFDQTVWDLAALGRLPHRRAWAAETAADREAVAEALHRVGAGHLAGRVFHSLSGGEKQRVLIARALAQQADHLVLDEPTNHLDVRYQLDMVALVVSLGVTVLVTLHDLNLAAAYCDQLYLLRDGRVRASGTPQEVLTPGTLAAVFGVTAVATTHPATGAHQLLFSRLPD